MKSNSIFLLFCFSLLVLPTFASGSKLGTVQNLISPPVTETSNSITLLWNKALDYKDVVGYDICVDGKNVGFSKITNYLLTAEDYSMQAGRSNYNNWNRWDYLNNLYFNPYYYSPYSYSYNPYSSFYRPMNSFGNQSTRYYYANILILSLNKLGKLEWSQVIHKDQSDDDNDNYLSFSTINSGVQIHFLFNDDKNKNQIIANQSISPAGILTRNPTLKSQERGYQFMPKLSKQVGANQIIIPCVYRNYICFAKVNLQ